MPCTKFRLSRASFRRRCLTALDRMKLAQSRSIRSCHLTVDGSTQRCLSRDTYSALRLSMPLFFPSSCQDWGNKTNKSQALAMVCKIVSHLKWIGTMPAEHTIAINCFSTYSTHGRRWFWIISGLRNHTKLCMRPDVWYQDLFLQRIERSGLAPLHESGLQLMAKGRQS